eukprot:gene19363-biopygen8992
MPVGDDTYIASFLSSYANKVQDIIDKITDIPRHAGPHQPAVQVANLLLRWCVPSKCTHLLRALPPRLTADFCTDIDQRVSEAFSNINDINENFGELQRRLYETPLQYGGLDMRALHDIREAAYVGGWLQCLCHLHHHLADTVPNFARGWAPDDMCTYAFHTEYRAAVDSLNAKLGVDMGTYAVLSAAPADALHSEQVKAQKELSRAVLACKFTAWKDTLHHKSRTLAILNMARSEDRRPLASEWLVTTPYCSTTTISDARYLLRIRQRLNIAVCERGAQCRSRLHPRTQPRFLTEHADHSQHCCKRARDERHDCIADLQAAINREAGARTMREVPLPDVLTPKAEPIRCDVLVLGAPPASRQCGEVKVRHFLQSDGEVAISNASHIDQYLKAVEHEVHKHYQHVPVRPWVMTSMGRPGAELCHDLRRLARQRLRLPDVQRAVSLPSIQQHLLRRWRAGISCALAKSDADIYLECLRGREDSARDRFTRPVAIYDLQSYRIDGQ